MKLPLLVLLLIICAACAANRNRVAATPIEVLRGGDDGLTLRFTEAVTSAFANSNDFVLGDQNRAPRLIVHIAPNVRWRDVGGRTEVSFTAQFTLPNGDSLATSRGVCWENELGVCARQLVSDAVKVKGGPAKGR